MALKHAQLLEVIDLLAVAAQSAKAVSLLKTEHLQLMRIVLAAGQALPEHHVTGEVTIQCVSGEVAVCTPGRMNRLVAGQMIVLPAAEPHSVQATVDSVLLVTALHGE